VPDAQPVILLPTPSPSVTPTPVISPTPSATPTIDYTATIEACNYTYELTDQVYNPPVYYKADEDRYYVRTLETFEITFTLRNTGDCVWEAGSALVFEEALAQLSRDETMGIDNEALSLPARLDIPGEVEVGDEAIVTFEMASTTANRPHVITWQAETPAGRPIGEPLSITLYFYNDEGDLSPIEPTITPEGMGEPLNFSAFVQSCSYSDADFVCDIQVYPRGGTAPYSISVSAGTGTDGPPYVIQLRGRRCDSFPYNIVVTDAAGESERQELWFDPVVEGASFPGGSCSPQR
jgi:hypothetical protein